MPEEIQSTVLVPPTPNVIRHELLRMVVADLHGPLGGEYEEFGREAPTDDTSSPASRRGHRHRAR